MASIDPARDTAKVLTDYVRGFVPGAHALRTDDPSQLKAAASVLGVQYDVKVAADGSEDVGHTSFVYAIDPAGKLVLQWSFGTPVKDYVHDLRILLDRVG
jgi:protein SCO1/2